MNTEDNFAKTEMSGQRMICKVKFSIFFYHLEKVVSSETVSFSPFKAINHRERSIGAEQVKVL